MKDNVDIHLSSDDYHKIREEIDELIILCNDMVVKERLKKLLVFFKSMAESDGNINLQKLISKKLKETKGRNDDLNATLYILLWDLKRGKISENEALELFKGILKSEEFDKHL